MLKKKVWLLLSLTFLLYWFAFAIPNEYYPNYLFDDNWKRVVDIFVELESYQDTGQDIPASRFRQLNTVFNSVLKYFPQTPENRVVYKKCLLLTEVLSKNVTRWDVLSFFDSCFGRINNIIEEISQKGMVKAVIFASPKAWSAPMTVTFDARSSVDPSWDTIPKNNYFWYYKDVNWNIRDIWRWSILSHTFNEPGNYVVHLTVRSSNNLEKWIFDWESSVNINVWPRAAVISIHINNKKLLKEYYQKIWTKEAQSWILIDWSWTYPTWWRKIESHKWSIKWSNNFERVESGIWNPWAFRLRLPGKWEYSIKLTINDNENNTITETYYFIVSDPIATIKHNPVQWSTSTTYKFDASLSYSLESRIKSYKWTVLDPNWNIIKTTESKSFQERFELPGNYSIKLTVWDELWNENDDQLKLYVDSTSPSPQFLINPVNKWKHPSEFVLDAWATSDIDVMRWVDKLTYDWEFSNKWFVTLSEEMDWWQKVHVSFNEPWKYKIKLIVTDKFNKISEIEREVNVVSSLRPMILVNPIASKMWERVLFSVKSNKELSYNHWDFWDKSQKEWSEKTVDHIYEKSWKYKVTLTSSTANWDENTVWTNVFVWERWFPVWVYEVKTSDAVLLQEELCPETIDGKTVYHDAYWVDRYENIVIHTKDSINSKWEKKWLSYYLKPENDEIYSKQSLPYKFSEVWCHNIEFTVRDSEVNKIDSKKIWFKVKNALPTLKSLSVSFPQYGNEMWVWITQNADQNKQQNAFTTDFDPLIVKVTANWAKDPDSWMLYRYKWYYYVAEDPDRELEIKVTPANINYVIFALPRIPWQYRFWVELSDTDWWKIRSEEIIWQWPWVFFQPDTKNPDIPIVTLKIPQTSSKVWEEVTFQVESQILSDKSDFSSSRVIKYDFDWDGTDDLTTKQTEVKYVYDKVWIYKPKVRVIYRWYSWRSIWENVEVTKWLKAWFLYDINNDLMIVRNISIWEIEDMEMCMDMKECLKDDGNYIQNEDQLFHRYDKSDKYFILMTVKDKYGNQETYNQTIDVNIFTWSAISKGVSLLSVPKATKDWEIYNIDVWTNLDNSVLYYVNQEFTGDCYIDTDISADGIWDNADWNPEWDKDFKCNELKLIKYEPDFDTINARIYYQNWTGYETDDITVSFIDSVMDLTENDKEIYDEINDIIKLVNKQDNKNDIAYLKTLLVNLRRWLIDRTEVNSVVPQIDDYISENIDKISKELIDRIYIVIEKLKDESLSAAMWWNQYDNARTWILNLMVDDEVRDSASVIFWDMENSWWNPEKVKESMQKIFDMIQKEVEAGNLEEDDKQVALKYTCDIFDYYGVPSVACNTEVATSVTDTWTQESGGVMWTILKVILWIIWILVVWFLILIVIFAIKAKRNQSKNQTNDSDWESADKEATSKN